MTETSLEQRYVRFTGTVGDAERAFGIDVMLFGDGRAYSNITDPALPSRLGGVISTVRGLDNFLHAIAFSHYLPVASQPGPAFEWSRSALALLDYGPALPASMKGAIAPVPATRIGGVTAFGPVDFFSYYNQSPLFAAGYNGAKRGLPGGSWRSELFAWRGGAVHFHLGRQPSEITTILVISTIWAPLVTKTNPCWTWSGPTRWCMER